MGADLSKVRIHTGDEPVELARSVQATAFTQGTDIYFGAGSYAPQTAAGQRVLAHELAHTVQQVGGSAPSSGLVIGRAVDPAEAAADRVADGVLAVLRRRNATDHADRRGELNSRSVNRTASPAMLRALSAAARAAEEPAIAAIQRTHRNRLAAQVIQRRLPEYANISTQLDPTAANVNAKVAQKKLKQIIKRTMQAMEERDVELGVTPSLVTVAKAEFQQKNPTADITVLLDESEPVLADSTPLNLFMQELKSAQSRAHRALTQVAYPGVAVANAPPNPAQAIVLDALVKSAAKTMRNIANGQHDQQAVQVFGAEVQAARITFEESAEALEGLKKDNKFIVDNRGDQPAVRSAGLTKPGRMVLTPNVVAVASFENQGSVIHESTHAIKNQTNDDYYLDVSPGSPFLTCPEKERTTMAPYYELLARHVLDNVATPLPVFGNSAKPKAGDATAPQKAVEMLVTRAWTVAINCSDELKSLATRQQDGWTGHEKFFEEITTGFENLSRVLGLTIHHRPPRADKRPPEITELDLAIAEDRAAQLAKLLKKAKGFNYSDDRSDFDPRRLFDTEYLEDKILRGMVNLEGRARKSPEREIAMIRVLASVYDEGGRRAQALMKDGALAKKIYAV